MYFRQGLPQYWSEGVSLGWVFATHHFPGFPEDDTLSSVNPIWKSRGRFLLALLLALPLIRPLAYQASGICQGESTKKEADSPTDTNSSRALDYD
jgi:hypothetical protein